MNFAVPHVRIVLDRHHNLIHTDGFSLGIPDRNLSLSVRTGPRQGAVFADIGQSFGEPMRQCNRERHQHVRLITSVAEHQPLIAGALLFLCGRIHTLRNIGTLLVNGRQHRTVLIIEAVLGICVSDLLQRVSNNFLNIGVTIRRYFTCNQHQSCGGQCFAGDPCFGILPNYLI